MVSSKTILLACATLLSTAVQAHPGPHALPDAAILSSRSQKAKRCASQIGALKQKRHLERKRSLAIKRAAETSFVEPSYDFISNSSCILTPEVSNGPYWLPASTLFRRNITEGEVGVPLELDIGVIDVATCEPLPNALLSIWHCNSTGYYSSFTGNDPNTRFGIIANETGIPLNSTDFRGLQTDNTTWLRGSQPTSPEGVAVFDTIFPGFYIQRTVHIHVQVQTDWELNRDGTVNSSRVVETGQIFASEELTQEIFALQPYASHTQIARWDNGVDSIFNQVSQSDAQSLLDAEPLDGEDFANGILGYITLAVDTTQIKDGAPPRIPLGGVPLANISDVLEARPSLTEPATPTET